MENTPDGTHVPCDDYLSFPSTNSLEEIPHSKYLMNNIF